MATGPIPRSLVHLKGMSPLAVDGAGVAGRGSGAEGAGVDGCGSGVGGWVVGVGAKHLLV
eukprot:CAMPEP_0179155058 /NCGR_PEP_ID=MMETSP0796-20121207/75509_1 /TAXON_ID=73915 /ORGANISM="Pyrodinium bahamense, Strain pbaha01" /LENGTH=59 /DNA_ID=CAMNT_0020856507 /DNA_START=1067 /DNA_END=1246 /DNA_ORIENTATION=+